ncbi:MAG TPA: TIGR03089 family protein [Rugosimonospora sp.]|nr:TIGR03089 family protein [Rugosimonospora sp.]
MTTLGALLAAATATDATRPLLTYYDDATGERTELSGATLGNWVAKTANLLVDGVAAEPGEVALVRLPPHWQSAGVLFGCWLAGLLVTEVPPPSGVSVAFETLEPPGGDPVLAAERFVLGLRPLGMPLPLDQIPPGYLDFSAEVRGYGDRFVPVSPVAEDAPAAPRSTHAELVERAAARARELGISGGDRVLVDAAAYPDHLDWLLAPFAAGASVVLCQRLDPARVDDRATAERITVRLR